MEPDSLKDGTREFEMAQIPRKYEERLDPRKDGMCDADRRPGLRMELPVESVGVTVMPRDCQ